MTSMPRFVVRVILGCAMVFAASTAPAAAAMYYVSTAGNDTNSCAAAQAAATPKLTIAAGLTCLAAGDTLFLRGGTYTGSSNLIDSERSSVPSGTSWAAAITIAGYPGETVTIRPPDGRQAIRLTAGAPHYLIFQDLILDGIDQTILSVNGGPDLVYLSSGAHHNRFERLDVRNNAANGFALSSHNGPADYNEILNCAIHDNGRLDEGNSGYGIYLKTSHNTIAGNDIYRNNGYGVHQNASAGHGNNNVILGNRIHDNAVHGTIGVGGSTSYAVVLINGDNNLIANNLIYGNHGGILIYNNTTNARVYNNTITGNRYNAIDLQYFGSAPFIRNNIVFNNGGTIVNYGGTGTPVVEHNLMGDPAFVDAAGKDFRLNWFSTAKDQGVLLPEVTEDFAGVRRPQAGIYDIGAFEYVDSVSSAQPSPGTTAPPAPGTTAPPAPDATTQPAPDTTTQPVPDTGTTTGTQPAPAPTTQPAQTTTSAPARATKSVRSTRAKRTTTTAGTTK